MIPTEDLPPSTSPHLDLLHPTEQEKTTIWRMNGQEWRGALSVEQYVRRERHLSNQALTRHGGIIFWLLTDTTKPPNARPILSSCESIRRKALVKRQDGKIEESISHGIESVFCDPRYRGRGYGKRMAQELGRKLDTWGQEDGRRTDFSVLYSDIGKVGTCFPSFISSGVPVPRKIGRQPRSGMVVTDLGCRYFMLRAVGMRSIPVTSRSQRPTPPRVVTIQYPKHYLQKIWRSCAK